MPKIDNDETKHIAQPFIIIAQKRSGGTYLTHCLSNHPQVFCDRGESVHHASVWRRGGVPAEGVYRILTDQEGYRASGFRMVYNQAFDTALWQITQDVRPKVIWLTRNNKLRQAVSIIINQKIRKGKADYFPVHAMRETGKPPQYTIGPHVIISYIERIIAEDRRAIKRISGAQLDYMPLTYTDMVGNEGTTRPCIQAAATLELCEFLGVAKHVLCCELKRVHSHPLRALLSNWNEVEAAIGDTAYSVWLPDEAAWVLKDGKWEVRQ